MTATTVPGLHPRHGVHNPTSSTPDRRPGTVRRTTTLDMLRPEGLDGPLLLVGRGRDLRTDKHGCGKVIAEAGCVATVDFTGGRILRELRCDPPQPRLDELVGATVSSGFRGALEAAAPDLAARNGLLHHLLDDLPTVTLVSGHAFAAGLHESGRHVPDTNRPSFRPDLCAGFAAGGTIIAALDEHGQPPLATGPVAPEVMHGDPLGWHAVPALPPGGMRRARRIDVGPDRTPTVDAFFRDTYVRSDGLPTVIHEYTLTATVDRRTDRVSDCAAEARVLPWAECLAAASSGRRIVGQPLSGLREHVRAAFRGPSTCTHLNDMLRALQDVPDLLRLAAGDRGTPEQEEQ